MKVAIAGAGIAGGYLARLFAQAEISVDIYDGEQHETSCGFRSCGWGAPAGIRKHLTDVGLDLNDYLIEPMPFMNFDGLVAKTPLCTVHTQTPASPGSHLRDRLKRQNLGPMEAKEYDVIVDATGITRALLPPCRSDLTLPTLQHRVAVDSPGSGRLEAGVYGNRIPGLGYFWIFPLGNGQYHIGVGGLGLRDPDSLMDEYYQESGERFSFTPLCRCTGIVRVASPYYSTPFFASETRKDGTPQMVVGVGESIGTVSPFTGEGIIYSLECARMLVDCWPDHEEYTNSVLARFAWMKKERETLDYLLSTGRKGPRLRDRWRFYRNARNSGIELPMLEAFKRMGSLSRWVEGPHK